MDSAILGNARMIRRLSELTLPLQLSVKFALSGREITRQADRKVVLPT